MKWHWLHCNKVPVLSVCGANNLPFHYSKSWPLVAWNLEAKLDLRPMMLFGGNASDSPTFVFCLPITWLLDLLYSMELLGYLLTGEVLWEGVERGSELLQQTHHDPSSPNHPPICSCPALAWVLKDIFRCVSISSTYPVGWYVCLLVSYSQFQISTLLVSLELDPRGTSNLGTMGCHIILKAMTKGYLMVSVGGV